jgi:hypothetical protein
MAMREVRRFLAPNPTKAWHRLAVAIEPLRSSSDGKPGIADGDKVDAGFQRVTDYGILRGVETLTTLAPTVALTSEEELSMLYKALPEALLAASANRSEEVKLANIVSRIKEIERSLTSGL